MVSSFYKMYFLFKGFISFRPKILNIMWLLTIVHALGLFGQDLEYLPGATSRT